MKHSAELYRRCVFEDCSIPRSVEYDPFCSRECCFHYLRLHRELAVHPRFLELLESGDKYTRVAVVAKVFGRTTRTARGYIERKALDGYTTGSHRFNRQVYVSVTSLARLVAIRHLGTPCAHLYSEFGFGASETFLNFIRSADYKEVVELGYPVPIKVFGARLGFWKPDLNNGFFEAVRAVRSKQLKERRKRPRPVPKGYVKLSDLAQLFGLPYHTLVEYKNRGYLRPSYVGLALGLDNGDIQNFVERVFTSPARFQVRLRVKLLELIEQGECWLVPHDCSKLRLGTPELLWFSQLSKHTVAYYLKHRRLLSRRIGRQHEFAIRQVMRCLQRVAQSKSLAARQKAAAALQKIQEILPHPC